VRAIAQQVSLLFTDHRYHLGELLIDAVIKETHELRAQVSEHPTESGESFCDHVQNLPVQIQIDGIISNTPMTLVGLTVLSSLANYLTDRSNDLAEEAFRKLQDLFTKREPIIIATTLKEYPNMVLESLSIERGGGTSESLHFKATAKQVRLVNQSLIDLPEPKVERAKPKQKMGKQESKPAAGQTQKSVDDLKEKVNDKQSSLLGAIFGLGN
jgi:hypothetical protein